MTQIPVDFHRISLFELSWGLITVGWLKCM
jgi:hypothetical protein